MNPGIGHCGADTVIAPYWYRPHGGLLQVSGYRL